MQSVDCLPRATKPIRLTERTLEPGLRWVHPETCLEYEDFHAWFAGDDPLPHWRNARIKEVHACEAFGSHLTRQGRVGGPRRGTEPFAQYLADTLAYLEGSRDRNGTFRTEDRAYSHLFEPAAT